MWLPRDRHPGDRRTRPAGAAGARGRSRIRRRPFGTTRRSPESQPKYRNVCGLLRTTGEYSTKVPQLVGTEADLCARCRTVTCGDGLRWMGCLLMPCKRSGVRVSVAPSQLKVMKSNT